jgi:putative addiction module component (TIGR02574 family)
MKTVQEIEAAVRTLSDDEYGLFRDWLCCFESEKETFSLHPEWEAELRRRINNLETGCAEGVPADQVFAEARALLHR